MTPEQAKEIDRLEFEAERARIHERANEVIAARRKAERASLAPWLDAPIPSKKLKTQRDRARPQVPLKEQRRHGPVGQKHTFDGETMNLRQWAAKLGITKNALQQRIYREGSVEAALAMGGPQRSTKAPGVACDFPVSDGTGGGCRAQDIPQIGNFTNDRT